MLKQSGRGDFPWCVRAGTSLADGYVEVKFKALAGKEDQAGGVVWRWKDGDNYYVARANALEDNVSLYYTRERPPQHDQVRGRARRGKPVAHAARGVLGQAHPRRCSTARPTSKSTTSALAGPGAVGVWTKADSVTVFDDFSFGGTPPR